MISWYALGIQAAKLDESPRFFSRSAKQQHHCYVIVFIHVVIIIMIIIISRGAITSSHRKKPSVSDNHEPETFLPEPLS